MSHREAHSRGVWLGAGAYVIWGLFPLYWKSIEFVPADQIICHRIAWSFVVLIPVLVARRSGGALSSSPDGRLLHGRIVAIYAAAGVLIAGNWYLYVWAVNHDFIVETSLGYFITPLVNVLIGVAILRERLRRWQWLAVLLATMGVAYLTALYGRIPWIAIGLALTFGTYGFVKKKGPYPALLGLLIETGILFVPAVLYLVVAERTGTGAFGHAGSTATLLMAGAGIVTTIPLLMFATAAQRVPLSLLGIVQYISPTLQFLLGVLLYREPFSHGQLLGFSLVWAALAVFAIEGARFTFTASSVEG